jgi:hypothetical protein
MFGLSISHNYAVCYLITLPLQLHSLIHTLALAAKTGATANSHHLQSTNCEKPSYKQPVVSAEKRSPYRYLPNSPALVAGAIGRAIAVASSLFASRSPSKHHFDIYLGADSSSIPAATTLWNPR